MAINIKIAPEAAEPEKTEETIKIKIADDDRQLLEFKLNMRRALNGDLMIFDHNDIDIVVMLEKRKIVAFAKDLMSAVVYGAESRLFEHLKRKGIVAYDSIQGGNVYGSLEAKILDSKELDSVKASLYEISQWMNEEKPYFMSVDAHDEMMDDALLDPDEDNSTELGDVSHEEQKGSILPHNLFAPYLYGRNSY
tara:strand:- start:10 stop:591 length:582 start_codon:yes stop_codon:yes gene_type:complete